MLEFWYAFIHSLSSSRTRDQTTLRSAGSSFCCRPWCSSWDCPKPTGIICQKIATSVNFNLKLNYAQWLLLTFSPLKYTVVCFSSLLGPARSPSLSYLSSRAARGGPAPWWTLGATLPLCLRDRSWTMLPSEGEPATGKLQGAERRSACQHD